MKNIYKVGEQVTLTTRYFHPSYYSEDPYVTEEITGVVIASPKWLTPDQIAIVPGPKDYYGKEIGPFHVVNINNIVESTTNEVKITKTIEEIQTWNIKGSKGNEYTVVKNANGYTCTCPGFTFRRSCKHLSMVNA